MSPIDLWLAPWRASLALTTHALDTMIDAQEDMLQRAKASGSGMDTSALPFTAFAGASFPMTPEQVRDAFHKMADGNLRAWEKTAEAVQKLPDWYTDLYSKPGEVLTDFFDQAKRAKG